MALLVGPSKKLLVKAFAVKNCLFRIKMAVFLAY